MGKEERVDSPPAEGAPRAAGGRPRLADVLGSIVLFVLFLGAWSLLSNNVSALVFPHPASVARELIANLVNGELWKHFKVTLIEVLLGFALGGVLGFGAGALLAHSSRAHRILMPYLVTTQAVPKFALAPIFVIWFG